jgi:hypothetical protein
VERERRQQALAFSDVAKRYLEWTVEHRPRSLTFRVSSLKHLVQAFDSKPLDSITGENVEAYQKRRQKDRVKPATVNRECATLSHLFEMSRKWGLIQSNPVSGTDPLHASAIFSASPDRSDGFLVGLLVSHTYRGWSCLKPETAKAPAGVLDDLRHLCGKGERFGGEMRWARCGLGDGGVIEGEQTLDAVFCRRMGAQQ